jgi:acetate kinase
MALLALNIGSSSLKATLFDRNLNRLLDAEIKGIHSVKSELNIAGIKKTCRIHNNIHKAFALLMGAMRLEPTTDLIGIGHRFIHGGWKYTKSIRLDAKTIRNLETLKKLAPLHNPESLAIIHASKQYFRHIPQIAVFDTAFHRTLPPAAAIYGIPQHLTKKFHIQRYGFHGIAHAYLASHLKKQKLITLHLGNGCSAAAILNGKSVETSMGFSPAEGLVMGTRAGDLDVTILEYLTKVTGKSIQSITHMLNFESGLLGVSGKTSDVKTLLSQKDRASRLAIELFCYRIIKTVGAYVAVLNGLDCLAFSGGIGENSVKIREKICSHLPYLGLKLSLPKNRASQHLKPGEKQSVQAASSTIEVYVINADEALFIARETLSLS